MGNGLAGKLHSLSPRSNKEFQSVLPFNEAQLENGSKSDISSVVASEGSAKMLSRKSSKSSKTTPFPQNFDSANNISSSASEKIEHSAAFKIASNQGRDMNTSEVAQINDISMQSGDDSSPNQLFDFQLTEGQIRRGRMADCETECSQITRDVYVGGYYVAGRLDILQSNNITRIINCSAAIVDNHFIEQEGFKYLSLNMVDGRQDDISWFLCEVLQFILNAKAAGERYVRDVYVVYFNN